MVIEVLFQFFFVYPGHVHEDEKIYRSNRTFLLNLVTTSIHTISCLRLERHAFWFSIHKTILIIFKLTFWWIFRIPTNENESKSFKIFLTFRTFGHIFNRIRNQKWYRYWWTTLWWWDWWSRCRNGLISRSRNIQWHNFCKLTNFIKKVEEKPPKPDWCGNTRNSFLKKYFKKKRKDSNSVRYHCACVEKPFYL